MATVAATPWVSHAVDKYFAANGTALNTANWGLASGGPYDQSFASGDVANFSVAGTGTGASIVVAGINASANFTLSAIGGTISNTSNGVVGISVAPGVLLDFGTNSFTNSATAGYIKSGDGVLALAGNTYGGGFTLNAGTVILRGVNGMGGGATNSLTINGGTIAANATRNLAGKFTNGITVGGNFTFGGQTIAGIDVAGGALTFTDTVNLGAVQRTISIGGNANYSLNGVVSGTGGLRVNSTGGTGTVVLGNTGNNFTGGVFIDSGRLGFAGVGALNGNTITYAAGGGGDLNFSSTATGAAGDVSALLAPFNAGTTVSLSLNSTNPVFNSSLVGSGTLQKSGAGSLILANDNASFTGNWTFVGLLQVGNGGAAGGFGAGPVAMTNSTTAQLLFNRSDTHTVSNVISGAGKALLHTGTGMTVLEGANTFSAAVTVSAGTLGIGFDAVQTTVKNTAVTADADSDKITTAITGLGNGHRVVFSGATPGGLTAGTLYYVVNKTANDFQLATTPGGEAIDLSTAGGAFDVSRPGSLGSHNAAVVLGDANSGGNTVGLLTVNGSNVERNLTVADFGGGTTLGGNADVDSTFSGNITLNKAVTLTSAAVGGNAVTYSGQITGGFDVSIGGVGRTVFSNNAKAYTGATTIGASSTLLVNTSLASSGVTVLGTLGGTGTIANAVAVNGGTIAPGASLGTLTSGTVTFSSGTMAVEIDTAGASSDLLAVNGDLNLGATTLSLTDLGGNVLLANDTKLTLITYSGTWNATTFAGLGDDTEFDFGANRFLINYNDSNAVTLTAVPEPASLGLLAIGSAGLLLRRRRKT